MTLLLFFGAGAGVTVMPAQLLPLLRGRAEREQPVLRGRAEREQPVLKGGNN